MKKSLSVWCWRAALVALSLPAFAFAIWVTTYWENGTVAKAGTLAATFGAPDAENRMAIIAMDADSPLARAGAHLGDYAKPDHRAEFGFHHFGTDETIGITLVSPNRSEHISVRPVPDKEILAHPAAAAIDVASNIASGFLALIIALLIGWRRAESLAMRLLSGILLIPVGLDSFRNLAPLGTLTDFYLRFINPIQFAGGYASFVLFALIYPEDRPLWRQGWIRRAFYVYSACIGAYLVWRYAVQFDTIPQAWNGPTMGEILYRYGRTLACLSVVASLAPLTFSWWRSSGASRQRLGWITVCIGAIYATWFLLNLVDVMGRPVSIFAIEIIQNVGTILALTGFGYVLLRHRLLDFGFAVNRALVVTIISSLLLVVFSITEWGVDKLLHFESREKNAVFDALVALGIILSFHRIQHWVNHRVTHTFFHHWHEAADKLRDFLKKAIHISQTSALQEKFLHAIVEFGGAQGAAFYAIESSGKFALQVSTLERAPAAIGANDDVAIDLKHTGQYVDLHDGRYALPGELAFAVMVRGRLNGIIVLGYRVTGDCYRPDQIALLTSAVHEYGLNLESLRIEAIERRADESEHLSGSLTREMEVLRYNVHDLRANNERLLAIVDAAKLRSVD